MGNFIPEISILFESATMQPITKYTKLENGHIEFDAVLQTTDDINRNTNCYPRDVLMEAISAPRIADLVRRNVWFGEQSHPYERKDFNRSVDILPDKITHRICQVPYLKGNQLISKVRTVEPKGKVFVSWVVDEGSQMGFSMRGLTPYSFTKSSPVVHKVIKSPMNIITYDAVFYPSHADALMMENGVEFTPATESTYLMSDIVKYFTEESAAYKIFRDELGISLDIAQSIKRVDDSNISATLEDGRLIKIKTEQELMRDIAQYII